MDLENGSSPVEDECDVCLTCSKPRKPNISEDDAFTRGNPDQGQVGVDKAARGSSNPLSTKIQSLKHKFEVSKTGSYSISDGLEKKGLLQRMHSLSLLKSKEKIANPKVMEVCQCDESGADSTRFRTWPERGRDKTAASKSPKKTPPSEPITMKETVQVQQNGAVHVNLLLDQLPIAYDPVSKQLRLLHIKEDCGEDDVDHTFNKPESVMMGHKRQPSLLSNISSTGSEAHLPLMSLQSKTHSHTSLSSLSNYSSSTGQTNSLERSCQPPRFGLSSFWQRAFTRKATADVEEAETSAAAASWKLFSRSSIFNRSSRSDRGSCSSLNSGSSPTSTPRSVGSAGLILHSRPSFLPAKCPEEELHHQLLHQKLLEESQKREQTKLLEAEKRMEELSKQEEQVAAAARVWSTEILPQWETSRKLRKTRDLWWQGLPPSVRGQVWRLAIGNDLNVTPELFALCLQRAREKLMTNNCTDSVGLEGSVEVIKLDLSRTFPHLGIFQQGGPYHSALDDLLSAYVCFRPDIGYVQGMSFLAATLLLNFDVSEAFISFANLLNRPLLHAFFRLDQTKMAEYYSGFDTLLKSNLPKVHSHFHSLNLSPDLYLQEWIYTLYSRSLPLDLASRVWDIYCRDGDDFVFRVALGILKLNEQNLLEMDFIHAAQLLTNLPEDIDGNKLFKTIEQLGTCQEKSRFSQILTHTFKVKGHLYPN